MHRDWFLARTPHGSYVRTFVRPQGTPKRVWESILRALAKRELVGLIRPLWLYRESEGKWIAIDDTPPRARLAADTIGIDQCDVWTLGGFLGDCFTGDDLSRLTANMVALSKDVAASSWGNDLRAQLNEFVGRYNAWERVMREDASADFSTIPEQVAQFRSFEAEYDGWRKRFEHDFGKGSSSGDAATKPAEGSGGFFDNLTGTAKSLTTLLLIGGAVYVVAQAVKR